MYLYHNGIMDVSFEINNSEGDQIMVALSYYDSETGYAAAGISQPPVFKDV